jgi:hypothetical protein
MKAEPEYVPFFGGAKDGDKICVPRVDGKMPLEVVFDVTLPGSKTRLAVYHYKNTKYLFGRYAHAGEKFGAHVAPCCPKCSSVTVFSVGLFRCLNCGASYPKKPAKKE